MQSELPRIVCKKCNKSQNYHWQKVCDHCGERFSEWHIAGQLKSRRFAAGEGNHVHERKD